MRVALDSNILIYLAGIARGEADEAKVERARSMLAALAAAKIVAPVQALGEMFVVMRRSGVAAANAREKMADMIGAFGSPASTAQTALAAADLVVDHKLQYWDAMIVSAAAEAGCALLLSEDMQHGFVTRGLTIVNPFAEPVHPKLAALMKA